MATDITIYRGKSYPLRYQHKDSSGAAVSLVGKKVYFTVKADLYDTTTDDSSALIKKEFTSHTDAVNGITDTLLTDTDTYIEPSKKYYYDFIVEDTTTHLAEPPSVFGKFIVLPTQTNRNVGNGE